MQVAELGSVQKTLLLPLWGRAVEIESDRRSGVKPPCAVLSAFLIAV